MATDYAIFSGLETNEKQGTSTDYVKRQYIGNLGKKKMASSQSQPMAFVDGMILPLTFEDYKLRERLKDKAQSLILFATLHQELLL